MIEHVTDWWRGRRVRTGAGESKGKMTSSGTRSKAAAVAAGRLPAAGMNLASVLRPDAMPRWGGLLARHYDPQRIENTLRSALAGDHMSQWDLFDLMEDTWPRLVKDLNELKRTVRGFEWEVEPWAEEDEAPSEEATRIAGIVSKSIWKMRPRVGTTELNFADGMYDLMDAWAKGVSVLEIEWEEREDARLGSFFAPRCFHWLKPDVYGWSNGGTWLGLRTEALADWAEFEPDLRVTTADRQRGLVPLPEDKFLVALCRSRTNHPMAGSLLRPLAFWWCAANFASEWFLNYAQLFGLPIRWAEYDPNVPGVFDKVCDMLEQMGSAAWAAFPSGTKLELMEASKGGADHPSASLLDRADRQCDLLILGQTLTTDVGDSGSRALGDVHAGVRADIMSAAAEWLEGLLQDQLVMAICRLNGLDESQAPELCGEPRRMEDQKANAERDAILLQAGLEMPKAWAYRRHGIPLPQAGEEVIGKGSPAPAPGPGMTGLDGKGSDLPQDAQNGAEGVQTPTDAQDAGNGRLPPIAAHFCEACRGRVPVRGASENTDSTESLITAVMEGLTGVQAKWLGNVRPYFEELVRAAKDQAVSDADFQRLVEQAAAKMPELFDQMDHGAVQDALEAAMGSAVVNGAVAGVMARR